MLDATASRLTAHGAAVAGTRATAVTASGAGSAGPTGGLRRPVVTATLVAAAMRLVSFVTIAVVAAHRHESLARVLGKADGVWYLGIARHGYLPPPPIGPAGTYTHLTDLAFFPLYPATVRAVHLVGLPWTAAAVVVDTLAGLVAAALIAAWARPLLGDRGGVVLVAAWSLLPTTAVLTMAYSEGLFVAAAAGALLALQRRQWLWAAVAATVAGATRPTGAAVVLAVWVAVAVEVRRSGLDRRLVAAAVVAPAGLVAALAHVAVATGRWDGWFWLERTVWRSGFDAGRSSWDALWQLLVVGGHARDRAPYAVGAVLALLAVAATVWLLAGRPRPAAADATYAVVAVVMAVGGHGYVWTKPRFLLVVFPLLLPLVRWLSRWRWPTLATVGLVALAATSGWNAYLVAVWPRSL